MYFCALEFDVIITTEEKCYELSTNQQIFTINFAFSIHYVYYTLPDSDFVFALKLEKFIFKQETSAFKPQVATS